jgi:hypothetical protein
VSFRDPRCLFAALVLLCACSNQKTAAAPYAFSRPEHLGFVCLDPKGSATKAGPAADPDEDARPLVLPLACCALSPTLSSSNPELTYKGGCPDEFKLTGVTATLHALVTQSTRGEIAAVDLVANRVIDSDVLVPGFTFVDVGGLPTAIVVPTERKLTVDAATVTVGPPWTYVASAEELHVRAVASCRFHESGVCGPEKRLSETDVKVPLPSAPADMILVKDALWVTMPDLGLIARIDLGSNWQEPFKLGADKKPATPTFFALNSLAGLAPKPAVPEAEVYQTSCGLGYAVQPGLEYLTLPSAPLAEPGATPRPTKMRFDATDSVLLVADQQQSAVRAFTVGDAGELVAHGVLPTGAPVRDFVLTPEVPVLVGEAPFTHLSDLPDPDAPTVRYLYGIDDRDGSVFVHTYSHQAGGVSSQPLLVPNARRYGDRLDFGAAAGLALDVIDTRPLSKPYCGQVDDSASDVRLITLPSDDPLYSTTLTAERDQALKALNAAKKKKPVDQDMIAAAQTTYDQAEARLDIAQSAGGFQLRGVFVAISATDAQLRIVDLHDLDAPCRMHNWCGVKHEGKEMPEPSEVIYLRDDLSDALPVAVRRHSIRQELRDDLSVTLSDEDALVGRFSCPKNYRSVIEGPKVKDPKDMQDKVTQLLCVANDTRRTRNDTWLVTPESVLPFLTLMQGYLAQEGDSIVLYAAGQDLCGRGLEYDGMPGRDAALAGTTDSVVIRSPSVIEDCPELDPQAIKKLPIKQAFDDRLVLDEANADVMLAVKCYPDAPFFYDVRATNQFVVAATTSGGPRPLDHRVIAADDGSCVIDTSKDPLLRSRIAFVPEGGEYEPFTNPFISFQLAKDVSRDPNQFTRLDIGLTSNLVQNVVFDPAQGRRDALPVTVQYFPYTDNLFVVDSASQGLRIFTLSPFFPARTSFR